MNWYFKILGGHTHVRCFMNGAKCGDLCFRNEEFELIRVEVGLSFSLNGVSIIRFIPEPIPE